MGQDMVMIKSVGEYAIFKRLSKEAGQETYAIHINGEFVVEFNSLRKAERFSERHMGGGSDSNIIDGASLCQS